MQYETTRSGRSRFVARLWLSFFGLIVCGCAEPRSPEARPAGSGPSSALTRFVFEPVDNPQLTAAAEAVITGLELRIELPFGSAVTELIPRIEHAGERVSPASGVAQDFSAPVEYAVTASDGSQTVYTVMVSVLAESVQPSAPDAGPPIESVKEIRSFRIAGVEAAIRGDQIELTVPHGTHLLNITPELVYEGAAILPSPLEPQDFGSVVVYTVMAKDGSTREYSVYVTVAPNHGYEITHFRVFDIESVIEGTDISLVLPAGTKLSSLVPEIILSGGSVTPPSGQPQDFTKPVQYTTTGADGSGLTYTVVITLAPGSANEILRFQVPSLYAKLRGDEITLFAPFGASGCTGVPEIEHAGVSIEPAVEEPQDFSSGVVYTVRAADGSTRRYTVSCQIAATSARGIASFEVLGLPATISGSEITLTVPNAASLGALTPTIVHHGVHLSPESGVAQSFYAPVTYTLLEADGQRRMYNVRVVNAERDDNTLVDVVYAGRRARVYGQKAELILPAGSEVFALTPALLHRGVRVIPSGTARDFTSPQIYGVIARDGRRRDYEVTIRVAAASDKELTHFELAPVVGTITGGEVSLSLPAGSDLRALIPSRLQHTGKSISPSADEPQDFTQPVTYVVTAADGSTRSYEVHVDLSPEG